MHATIAHTCALANLKATIDVSVGESALIRKATQFDLESQVSRVTCKTGEEEVGWAPVIYPSFRR